MLKRIKEENVREEKGRDTERDGNTDSEKIPDEKRLCRGNEGKLSI
jgi:hypothetical protein